ncbi:Ig-like domain-containing protein [Mucilaginibacter sp. ZT4R22]|uniref:Ig-like domain-containing protein n=1 Tax=Mucilaginibacter pankratovii TaxID=2772110 RepID=A0ABR7WM86_9SPHI|nr:Ig-like domain-containing protein [Mucilaginibacter pankratovii]MBD1363435.1 Ig-like domain-containing protein [Mucilaginibacter pankratovii]
MLNPKPVFFSKNFFLFVVVLLFCGCAAQQKPQGGPRDLTPPKILKATPEDQTRNFKAKEIRIDFDEYFRLTNQYQEIVISPAQEKQPEYKTDKKSLIIQFKDTLLKNTTYVINFGKAIADVNESNVLKNYTYVFSTGSHIDSLSLSGNVINSTTGLKEKDATVFLFPLSQDSLLFGKKKPGIFTTTDTAGNFSLNNLREDTYRIYALKENSPDKIFNNDNDLIAFTKNPIKVDKDSSNILLKLFKQVPDNFRVAEKKFTLDGKLSMIFNRPVQKPSIKILYPAALDNQKIVEFTRTKDTAVIYMRNMAFDSLSVAILDNNKPIDTIYQNKSKNEKFDRTLNFSFGVNRDNKLKPGTDLPITGNFPLESYDAAQIVLLEDSIPITNFTLTKDTANLRKYYMKYRWRVNSKYQLSLNDGAFTDIYGDKNKKFYKPFTIDKPENYSQLTLKVSVPADTGKTYIIELLDDIKNVLRTDVVSKNTSLVYKNYATIKYTVRVTYDTNHNGRWDSGNVKRRAQPETIWVSPKEIVLRANWEAEEPLEIPKEQTNP